MKKLTLKTKEGCWRLLAIFIAIILLSGFVARMISSSGGSVKISRVTYDSRGATANADLYYPAGTSDKDSLPAVLVAHGGGVSKGVVQGMAEEIARRGYVVLCVDAYGSGISEQPKYDEGGQGIDGNTPDASPGGMIDALNFVRTLNFVDQERIGMVGHSMGSRRTGYAAIMDCGYYTLNDLLINALYEEFGQTFTLEEISMDADALAAERLNADQLVYYNAIKEECEEYYNTRLKAVCLVGSNAPLIGLLQTVEVGGHEVQRNCQVNFAIVNGSYDFGYKTYPDTDTTKEAWYTGEDSVVPETWYIIDDYNATSTQVGAYTEVSVLDNAELKAAIDNRSTRLICFNPETHSKNFFSIRTTSDMLRYFEQTLAYNGGELGSADANPVDTGSVIFVWREMFNLIAMLAMVGLVISAAALLVRNKFFVPCIGSNKPNPSIPFNKKRYWLFNGITVVVAFATMYYINGMNTRELLCNKIFPLSTSWWMTPIYLAVLGVMSGVFLVVEHASDKKRFGASNMASLNFNQKVPAIIKNIFLSIILVTIAYASLMVLEYLFNEDYRFWMASFQEMRAEHWSKVWIHALFMFPSFLLIGASVNYSVRTDIPEWKDTLITVVMNSLGVWLLCAINFILLKAGATSIFSDFKLTYGFVFFVPLTLYLTRKCYKITHNIWHGAALCSLMLTWALFPSQGYHSFSYMGQHWVGNFFNI